MNTIAYTVALLTLLAALTYNKVNVGLDQAVLLKAIGTHIEQTRELENNYQQELFTLKCNTRKSPIPSKKKPDPQDPKPLPPPPPKGDVFLTDFPPFTLNLIHALDDPVYEELVIAYLQNQYPEDANEIPLIFERIKEKSIKLERPQDLACLPGGPTWIKLLRGDLLKHLIAVPGKKGIYVAFAKRELVEVLFDDAQYVFSELEHLQTEHKAKRLTKKAFAEALENLCRKRARKDWGPLLYYTLSYEPKTISAESGKLSCHRLPAV